MKAKILLIFTIIISFTSLNAEFDVFQIALGSSTEDYANSIMQTPDNGFIIAGWTTGFGAGSYDAYVAKIDSTGALEWSKTYGGPYGDWFRSGYCTDDGGYIFLGTFESNVSTIGNLFLIKTDANGNQEWKKKIGGSSWDDGWCVQQTDDGGYILSGFTYSYSPSNGLNSYIVKTSSLGIVEWTKSVGPTNLVSNTRFIRQTSDGGFIVSGSIGNYSLSSTDMLLYKMDASGNVQWYKTYGETGKSWGYCAKETSDNGFISVGYSNDYGAGQNDIIVVKTDSEGELEWSKAYGGTGSDYGMAVVENELGEFVITGFSNSFSNSNDVILFKIDNLGNVIWSKSYGGNSSDGGEVIIGTMSVEQTNTGYAFAGFTQSYGAGYRDFYITKTDENGFSGTEGEIEFLTEDIAPTIEEPVYSVNSGGSSVNANNSTSNPNTQVEIICQNTVGIGNELIIPEFDYQLQNFPNPFNPSTTISFNIPAKDAQNAVIEIYNLKGQKIQQYTILNNQFSIIWDGTDNLGKSVSSGIYLYKLKNGSYTSSKKMILMK
ncbi:MAG: T9SS type A sorting domain-containing protein [Candidatus Cloacimonetes bacterium]|nr:T9SS type A sorting domain-containing protein [Candidatus Cloacimonadota bacterium]